MNLVKRIRKRYVALYLVITALICLSDSLHQKEMADLMNTYNEYCDYIDSGNYDEEITTELIRTFDRYLKRHGYIFWELQERYGNRYFTKYNIQKTLRKLRDL